MNGLLSSAAESMQGELHGRDRPFAGVSTDTRAVQSGELFFALAGPNFDGADFVGRAKQKGAAGAVVTRALDEDIAQITVSDTRLALGRLGSAWRDEQAVTVVGVTGSNGKTTLKELIAACLARVAPTIATDGNLNNDIGMPLMLLRIDAAHQYAVLEMGANHAGEIAYLTSLARPDIVVITNAGAAHLEGFGSIEGVARAKGEILQGKPRPTTAILNADDHYFDFWRAQVSDTGMLSFGFSAAADVRARRIEPADGRTTFELCLAGETRPVSLALAGSHNVRNACAAAAVATALAVPGDEIVAALESVQPVTGRLQPLSGIAGSTLLDDSYNANPLSVIAAAEYLASLPGRSWFVLGDMYELGEDAERIHSETGAAIRAAGVERLLTLGDLSRHAAAGFGARAAAYATCDELIAALAQHLAATDNVLVKGSRGMRMERVVEALRVPDDVSREA